jgi:hypothetical protein
LSRSIQINSNLKQSVLRLFTLQIFVSAPL